MNADTSVKAVRLHRGSGVYLVDSAGDDQADDDADDDRNDELHQ